MCFGNELDWSMKMLGTPVLCYGVNTVEYGIEVTSIIQEDLESFDSFFL